MEALRAPLPCTFRVTGYKSYNASSITLFLWFINLPGNLKVEHFFRQARELLKVIQSDYFNDLTDVVINGKKLDPPKNLQWYVNVVIFSSVLTRAS